MTDETARLVVAVDSTSAGKATDVLDAMTNSAGNAEDMVAALSKAFGPVAAEIAKLTSAIDRQVSSYENLATVGQQVAAANDLAAKANEQAAKATNDQAKATEALGETAEQARDRIRAMVDASMDQVRADAAAAQATQKRGEASRSAVTDINAQVAANRRAQEAAEAYRQRSAASADAARAGAGGTDAQRVAFEKLLKQIDPTIAALERLDQQEEQLRKAKSAGLIGGDDFERFASTIQQRRKDIGDAGESLHGFSLNSAAARREFGTLIGELARGDIGNFQSSLLTMANNTGLLAALLSPAALGVGALAGSIGVLVVAAAAGYTEQQAITRAIIATGDAAGVTASQVNGMAANIGATTGQYGRARDALQGLIESGKVSGDTLQQAGQLAVDMAEVTGKSLQEAVASVVALRDDPVRAIRELDDQYHVLTATQYEHIKQLAEEGRAEEAATAAQDAASQALEDRRKRVVENLGFIERKWRDVRDAASEGWDAIKGIGRSNSTADDLADVNAKLQGEKNNFPGTRNMNDADFLATATKYNYSNLPRIRSLLTQKDSIGAGEQWDQWVAQNTADNQKVQEEGKRASDVLDDYARRAKADEAKAKDIAKVKEATQKALAARPQDRAAIEAQQAASLKYIETQYTDKAGQSAAKALDSAQVSAEAAKFKSALAGITDSYSNQQKQLDAERKSGAVAESYYYQQSRDLLWRGEADQVSAIQAEIARLQQRKLAGADRVKNDQRIAELSADAHKLEADAISRDNVLVEQEASARDKTARAINAYVDALGRQEAAARADADLQVQRLSMGDREFSNMQRIISIRRQGADELVRLSSQLSNKQIDQAAYDAQAQAQQASTDRLVQIEEDAQKRVNAARADWTTGSRRAMAELSDQATDTAGTFYSFVTSTSGGLSDFLASAATKGTASIKGFVSSVLSEAARLASNRAVASLLSYGLSFFTPSAAPASSTASGFGLTGGDYAGAGSTAVTWGGYRAGGGSTTANSAYRVAEQHPEVYRTAGGQTYLLTGQEGGTITPMQNGAPQGSNAGAVQVAVNINIASDGSASSDVTASQASEFGKTMGEQMRAVAQKEIAMSMQPGGKLWRASRG